MLIKDLNLLLNGIMKNRKKVSSTFEKLMQDPEWKAGFEKGYEKGKEEKAKPED